MNEVLFLIGPTASGKTDIAINLAKKLEAEIISCDSMQLYKGMDILSQKPTASQRKNIPHYMVSILNPGREFNVASYKKGAECIIKKIRKKGKLPLIVGGSGLYVKALVDGLFPFNRKNAKLRSKLTTLAKKYGNKYLHEHLEKIDPETAKLIHPNNTRRIIRALEVCELSGTPISEMKKKAKGLISKYDIIFFGIRRSRQDLYERINRRVEKMFKGGLIDEVKKLRKKSLSRTAKAALGYKEVSGFLEGKYTKEDAKQLLKRNTRRFAKRQITWFKKDPRIIWVEVAKNDTKDKITKKILKKYKT